MIKQLTVKILDSREFWLKKTNEQVIMSRYLIIEPFDFYFHEA